MERGRRGRPDPLIALVLLAFAGGYGWLAFNLPERNIPGSVGLDFVPKLLAGLLSLLAVLLFVQGPGRGPGDPPGAEGAGWAQAAVVVGLMVAYVAALTHLGFLLATPPYLAVSMWRTGARHPGFILLVAVAMTVAARIVFVTLFAVPLPHGLLF